ncbi:MAG: phage terminase large subunit [Actinomycetota bacterium]
MVFAPPRHGKSEQGTIRLPVWCMERDQTKTFCVGAYSQEFSERFGRRSRRIAEARGLLSAERSAATEWEVHGGGAYRSCGVGSPPTGEGFTGAIIIDDPIRSRAEAESKAYRTRVLEWFGDLYTRREPGCSLILTMTRWHDSDLAAALLEAAQDGGDQWEVVRMPALAETQEQRDAFALRYGLPMGQPDPIGREPGEALWPARWPADELRQTERVKGAYAFGAEYQQDPRPRTGGFFEVDKLNYVDASEVPPMVRVCRAWDTAASEGAGDYTAGVKIGRCAAGRYWVLHCEAGQWGTARRDARIRSTAEADGKGVQIRFAQDPGGAGVDQAKALIALVAGYSAKAEVCSGSKEVRADPWSAQVNGGNVYVVRGTWNEFWRECHEGFPTGKYDDPVDASADGFKAVCVAPSGPIRTVKSSPAMLDSCSGAGVGTGGRGRGRGMRAADLHW